MEHEQLVFREEDARARETGKTVITRIQHGKDRYVWIFLPGGLQVMMPLERRPVVDVSIIIRQGTMSDEIPGIAHALEHLVCKDPLENGPHPALRSLVPIGLRSNARTVYNRTVYMARSPHHGWNRLLTGMIKMVFASEIIDEKRWFQERPAILHETRGRSDLARTREAIEAAIHPNVPRLQSTMCGSEKEILSISADDLIRAYTRGYHPQNAVIIITGMDDYHAVIRRLEHSKTLRACAAQQGPRVTHTPFEDFGIFDNLIVQVPGGRNIERLVMRSSLFPSTHGSAEMWRTSHLLTMLCNNFEGLIMHRLRKDMGLLYAGGIHRETFKSDIYHEFEAGTSPDQMEALAAAWRALWKDTCRHILDPRFQSHIDMMMGTYNLISAERKLGTAQEDSTAMLTSWWMSQQRRTAFKPNMYDLPKKALPDLLAQALQLADLEWQEIRVLPA